MAVARPCCSSIRLIAIALTGNVLEHGGILDKTGIFKLTKSSPAVTAADSFTGMNGVCMRTAKYEVMSTK